MGVTRIEGQSRPGEDVSEDALSTCTAFGDRSAKRDLWTGVTPELRKAQGDELVGPAARTKDQDAANVATRSEAFISQLKTQGLVLGRPEAMGKGHDLISDHRI